MPLRPGTIDVLAATPGVLRALLASQPDAATTRPGEEGWCAADVVAHLLANNEWAIVRRVELLRTEDHPLIPNMDEHKLLESSGVRGIGIADLLDRFERERIEAVAPLRSLTDADLARGGTHEIAGELTLADILHHLAFHDLLHIRQAASLLAVPLDESRGAMRMFG